MTCAEAKESFNHVLDKVLDRGDSSSLKRSLIEDGITDIFDLVTILDEVIDSLVYKDPDDKIFYPVKKGDKMLQRCFLAYHQSLESVTGDVDYNAITQANFDSYCISPVYTLPARSYLIITSTYNPFAFTGQTFTSQILPYHHQHLHPLCLRLHPNLRTIHQLLCSITPSRKILHSFRL
jgi:hypothetical protein